jgi:hypothetical protein
MRSTEKKGVGLAIEDDQKPRRKHRRKLESEQAPVPVRVPVRKPLRVKTKKDHRNYAVKKHGLFCNPAKWVLDGRSSLAKTLAAIRRGLIDLFPTPGPDRAAMLLIDRVTFKQVRLAIYEVGDMAATAAACTPPLKKAGKGGGGHANSGGNFQKYLQLSNSFREDLRLLIQLAQRQSPVQTDPDLAQYLEMLKAAAKATPVNVERS